MQEPVTHSKKSKNMFSGPLNYTSYRVYQNFFPPRCQYIVLVTHNVWAKKNKKPCHLQNGKEAVQEAECKLQQQQVLLYEMAPVCVRSEPQCVPLKGWTTWHYEAQSY